MKVMLSLVFVAAILGCNSSAKVGKRTIADLQTLQPKITIGMTEPEVVAIAGAPDDRHSKANVLLMIYNASLVDMLVVSLKDGTVVKVNLMTAPPAP